VGRGGRNAASDRGEGVEQPRKGSGPHGKSSFRGTLTAGARRNQRDVSATGVRLRCAQGGDVESAGRPLQAAIEEPSHRAAAPPEKASWPPQHQRHGPPRRRICRQSPTTQRHVSKNTPCTPASPATTPISRRMQLQKTGWPLARAIMAGNQYARPPSNTA